MKENVEKNRQNGQSLWFEEEERTNEYDISDVDVNYRDSKIVPNSRQPMTGRPVTDSN